MGRILYFEGAGCVPRGDVENCRIRTAFRNRNGERIYLELVGIRTGGRQFVRGESVEDFAGFVMHCLNLDTDTDLTRKLPAPFQYSKEGIREFVNSTLHCDFSAIRVLNSFDGYRVFGENDVHMLMEDADINDDRAEARRKAYNQIDAQIRKQLCERQSKITLYSVDEKSITVRIYASAQSMQAHGLDPNQRLITVKI